MKKVYLEFRTKQDLLGFLEYSTTPLCIVDAEKNRIICQLSEEELEYARKKFKANLVPEITTPFD
jgi:hypothetical protein